MRGYAGAVVLHGERVALRRNAHSAAAAVFGAVDEQLLDDERGRPAVGRHFRVTLYLHAHARCEQQFHLPLDRLVRRLPQAKAGDAARRARVAQAGIIENALGEVVRAAQLGAQSVRIPAVGEDEGCGGERRLEFVHPLFHIVAVFIAGADGGLGGADGRAGDLLHDRVVLLFHRIRGRFEHFAEQITLLPHLLGSAPQTLQTASGAQVLPQPQDGCAEGENAVGKGNKGGRNGEQGGKPAPCGGAEDEDARGNELRAQKTGGTHSRYPTPRTV